MTRLFIRFYVGVLVVLFLAWYIDGFVLRKRSLADRARVVVTAHAGGARLVVSELDAANSPEHREEILGELRHRFDYALEIVPFDTMPTNAQEQILDGAEIAYREGSVFAKLQKGEEVVRLGPFPSYRQREIEESLAGWMRLTRERIDRVNAEARVATLDELRELFDIPIEIARRHDLPENPSRQISANSEKVAFYTHGTSGQSFSVIGLVDGTNVIRFGPFPRFDNIENEAATTTLALVLLPAALAIALLLRPVARQLRQVENAAEAIARGDLSTRVDQNRMNSAKPLAQAFNHMAERTESLVRTQRELLQAVSHELRTPLSRMRFAVDLIGTAKNDDERKLRLESLDAATEELDALVGELLSYVRMETAEPRLAPEIVYVRETVSALVSKFAALYPSIEFCGFGVSSADQNDPIVWADRVGFQRAMGNLLSNAGRHAKRRVVVSADSDLGTTIINVDDDGRGIPESDRERVFEPFVRLENGAIENGHGVGLGLALVQRIVTQNSGTVQVQTSPLGGCRITTKWPTQPSNDRSSGPYEKGDGSRFVEW